MLHFEAELIPLQHYSSRNTSWGSVSRLLARSGTRVLIMEQSSRGPRALFLFDESRSNTELYMSSSWLNTREELMEWLAKRRCDLADIMGVDVYPMLDLEKTLRLYMKPNHLLQLAREDVATETPAHRAMWLSSFPQSSMVKDYLKGHGVRFAWGNAFAYPTVEGLKAVLAQKQTRRMRIGLMDEQLVEDFCALAHKVLDWVCMCDKMGLRPDKEHIRRHYHALFRVRACSESHSGAERMAHTVLQIHMTLDCDVTPARAWRDRTAVPPLRLHAWVPYRRDRWQDQGVYMAATSPSAPAVDAMAAVWPRKEVERKHSAILPSPEGFHHYSFDGVELWAYGVGH